MTGEAFHAGERALQARAGVRERMAEVGAHVLRSFMPEQHRTFFAQLPLIVVGSLDAQGQPWASLLAGAPGFVESPDPRRLVVHGLPAAASPLAAALKAGANLGILGIEPQTRRRNRMNGVVVRVDAAGFEVEVRQSFGNCPKYIQARKPEYAGGAAPQPARTAPTLASEDIALIRAADTFFIASAHPQAMADDDAAHGVDVSHRGGRPGFIRVDGDDVLMVPDFSGNFFFNTLGNLAINPRAGLVFVDFASGAVLQVAVDAQIVHDDAEIAAYAGAQRLLRLTVREVRRVEAALPLRWGDASLSPHLAGMGHW